MKYFSILALLMASAAYGQSAPVMVDFSGVPANGQPTQAQLNASVLGTAGGGAFNAGAPAGFLVVTATNSPCFPAATLIGGTPQLGCGNKVLQWTTSNPSPFLGSFNYVFRAGAKTNVSEGHFFCADFDVSSIGGQYSNHQIDGASNTEVNTVLGPNPSPGGLALENDGSGGSTVLAYHGGNCLSDPTNAAWRWITLQFRTGAQPQMQVWDAGITTMLFSETASFGRNGITPNPGLLQFGITGGETETVGHHIYWKDAMMDDVTGVFPLNPATTAAPLWSGILAPARATDWTTAGVIGGIPSASYTQCGSTIAAYSGAPTTISNQLATCSANQFVLLGPGTFTLNSTISWPQKSNLVLRGSSATSTKLVFTGGGGTLIAVTGTSGTTAFTEWTAGYAQGTNQITVASAAGVTAGQSVAILDQCEDAFSGDTCSTGTSTDNGNFFNCSVLYGGGTVGCSSGGPDGTQTFRWQQERSLVTNIAGNVLTLQDTLRHPNWASARTPHAQFNAAPLQFVGIENMALDGSAAGLSGSPTSVALRIVANAWIKGVEVTNSQEHCLGATLSSHVTITDNYCAGASTNVAHCIASAQVAKDLYQNNICIGFSPAIHTEQSNDSSVMAYNYILTGNNIGSANDNMGESFREHSNGAAYELWEGNEGQVWRADITHGTEPAQTTFRNFSTGWDSCATGQCGSSSAKDFETNALIMDAFSRYHNHVGNVLGTPTYHTVYRSDGTPSNAVMLIGEPNGVNNPPVNAAVPHDPLVDTTMMLWSNYDTVNGAVLQCTAPGVPIAACVSDERGDTAPVYPGLASPATTFPPSFYLSSKPSWFGSLAWPPIGPDVSSGNVVQCSGSLNVAGQFNGLPALSNAQCGGHGITTRWGGHANANPAMACYLNIMGGTVDGLNPPLAFDPNVCYAGAVGSVTLTPSSLPFGTVPQLATIPLSTTLTNSSGGSTITISSITVNGPNASDFTTTSTCGATLGNGITCSVTVSFKPTAAIGTNETATLNVSYTGFTGSPVTASLSGTVGSPLVTVAPSVFAMNGTAILQGKVILK